MTPSDLNKISGYLDLAHADHLAARLLIRNGFLEHGCVLASTAVEKYLKAVMGIHGMVRTEHLDKKLLDLVRSVQPELLGRLDQDFLQFLGKAFRLRYANVSSPGFSIVINQYRTLIALDFTVMQIDVGFKVPDEHLTPFRRDVKNNNQHLMLDNAALSPSCIEELMIRSNRVLELKVGKGLEITKAAYSTKGVNASGSFLKKTEIGMELPHSHFTRS